MKARLTSHLICIVVAVFWIAISIASESSKTDGNRVIISINGVNIFDHELENPSSFESTLHHEINRRRLQGRMMQILKDDAVVLYGIEVTQVEVDRALNKMFDQAGVDEEMADHIIHLYTTLFSCLEQWHANRDKSDHIYKTQLAGMFLEEEWAQWQQACPDSEHLKKLKAHAPVDIDSMKENSFASVKSGLLTEKLLAYITRDIKVHQTEIEHLYNKRYAHEMENRPPAEIQHALEQELLEEYRNNQIVVWWRDQFIHAKIEVFDDRFKDIKHEMIQEFSHREDPRKALLKAAKMFTNTPPQEVLEAESSN